MSIWVFYFSKNIDIERISTNIYITVIVKKINKGKARLRSDANSWILSLKSISSYKLKNHVFGNYWLTIQ
jgi:hypothetical protein